MNYGKKGVREKQRALNSKVVKWEHKLLLGMVELILIAMIGLGICGVSAGLGAFKGILYSTPSIRLGDIVATGQATIVYDNMGNEIDQYVTTNSNRIPVASIDMLPDYLGNAFVAIEDERFYQHNGIDYKGILRAGYQFLKTEGDETQGGSTITQQLLKNTVFTEWTSEGKNMIKKIKRKLQEQYLALEISKYYSKEDILLCYMNAINLSQNTLGVEAAAQRYFGKSASDLTVSESAVIASITQNPTYNNPIRYPESNARRRDTCLNKMLELGFITPAQYDEAMADTDSVYERIRLYDETYRESTIATAGSYFSDAVYEQVKEDLINIAGYSSVMAENLLTSGGLRIESTLDPAIQAIADEEFANPDNFPDNVDWYLNYALTVYRVNDDPVNFSKENMMKWFKENQSSTFNLIFKSQDAAYEAIETYRTAMMEELGVENDESNYEESISMTPQPQAALVIEDQRTGYVVAMVGGRGTKEGRRTLNRATSALRSPGSTFKPLSAFAPALDSAGQTLATVYLDAPFNYADGTPVDNWYKTGYRGIQSVRDAIRDSLNVISVKALTVITPQLGYDYLVNFGFTTVTDGVWIGDEFYTDIQQTQTLGGLTYGVSPYELNAAYATIANGGIYVTPKLYSRVTDSDGNVILDNTTPPTRRVIKETTAYLLTSAMVDVVTTGTGAAGRWSRTMGIAGKTGTSTGPKDVWFAGFTPYYTCSVWAGYDNSISFPDASPYNTVARNLWRSVMSRVHENLPDEGFDRPQGIVQAQVCSRSGKLPIDGLCNVVDGNHVITEFFAEGTVPTEICDVHYEGNICEYDMLPASVDCPFSYYGYTTLPLIEDEALISGSTSIVTNPDGTQSVTQPRTAVLCQHDAAFFANPDYEAIQAGQQLIIDQRRQAAADAAAAAEAAAAEAAAAADAPEAAAAQAPPEAQP